MELPKPNIKVPADLKKIVENDPLGEFFVWWMGLPANYKRDFEQFLSAAKREGDLQRFLTASPYVLAVQMGGGHGRWVIPSQRLGCEYVTDFLGAERSSVGFEWYAVELESPKAKMFTKAGDPSCRLTHAIRQIDDWRAWLRVNQNYAARPRNEAGLGLTDIDASLDGLILIGRAAEIDESTNKRRREMSTRSRIKIHSYDWLLGSGGLSNLPTVTS